MLQKPCCPGLDCHRQGRTLPPHGVPITTGSLGSNCSQQAPPEAPIRVTLSSFLTVLPYGVGQLASSQLPKHMAVGCRAEGSREVDDTGQGQNPKCPKLGQLSALVAEATLISRGSHIEQGQAMLPRLWSNLACCPLQSRERHPAPLIWQLPFSASLQGGTQA